MNNMRFLVMDVDGTLTDGKVYISAEGEWMKAFHIKDGYGIRHLLPAAGIEPVIITGRTSAILERRCRELGIERLFQGASDTLSALKEILSREGVSPSETAFIGDDLNDLPCMEYVNSGGGVTGCPADAVAAVRRTVTYVSSLPGGEGAVRDFIDRLCG